MCLEKIFLEKVINSYCDKNGYVVIKITSVILFLLIYIVIIVRKKIKLSWKKVETYELLLAIFRYSSLIFADFNDALE